VIVGKRRAASGCAVMCVSLIIWIKARGVEGKDLGWCCCGSAAWVTPTKQAHTTLSLRGRKKERLVITSSYLRFLSLQVWYDHHTKNTTERNKLQLIEGQRASTTTPARVVAPLGHVALLDRFLGCSPKKSLSLSRRVVAQDQDMGGERQAKIS